MNPSDPPNRQCNSSAAFDQPLITALRARAVNVPLDYPIRTSSGTVATSPLVLVDVTANNGVSGHAYLFTYTPLALGPVRDLLQACATFVVGQPLAPHAIDQAFEQRFRLMGHTGLARMVSAGIDMAVWDALARSREMPLAVLLGGALRPIPAYDSHSMDGTTLGVERACRARELGFRAVKTKIGYATLDEDLVTLRALRHALGDDIELMADYNQSLSVPEAIQRGLAVQQEGLGWLEEPTLQHDYAGHARVRDALDVPVQIGENWFGIDEMQKAIAAQAMDFAMPDVMKIGGVTGWLKAAALAQAHGLPMSSHLFQEFSAHLQCVTPTAHWLEKMGVADAVLATPLRFDDGHALLSSQPGAGIEWNEEAVERYKV